ncbi:MULTISPECIES: DUF5050 domain-containing protein [Clostridium]|uniref:DUF5050 domain-containing protein n=1 Tax=Clostridium TaxID=1485 RepID=UPI00082536DF|nr:MULTISPECIES: DUF5050 domain-containing protein [Clostridium]PJI06943.1 hypothetical protein CUB90_03255 [Clostridium sp. CT7]
MKKAKYRISLALSISLMASLSNTTVFNKIQAANSSNVYASTLSSDVSVSSVTLNKETDTLTVGDTDTLTATVAPDNATNKSVTWTTSDSKIATVSSTGVVTAVSAGTATIVVTTADGSKTSSCNVTVNNPSVGVTYDAHVQNIGWQTPWAKDGSEAGTEGKAFRIEALKINLTNAPAGASIAYQTHIQNVGWQDSKTSGDISGTTGKGLRIEAIKIKLQNMPGYSVAYQAYIENIGWQDWKYDDDTAGTTGKNLRVEALKVKIVPTVNASSVSLNKTTDTLTAGDTDTLTAVVAPDNATNKSVTWTTSDSKIATVSSTGVVTAVSAGTAKITATTADGSKTSICDVTVNSPGIGVTYDAHVQNIGWQTPWSKDGSESGTEGKAFRIEALKINLTNAPAGASISYQTHIQNIGWQDYKSNGDISGTTGKGLRIEGIKIKLQNMPDYSVAYQAYIENIGWQDWKYDDDAAGTTGKNLRIEALKVKIVPKQNTNVNVSNEIGNTNSNLANNGLAAEKNNWIYYDDISSKTLNKVSTDGTSKQVLVSGAVRNINVVGDWVYYTDENNNAYKVKTDGTSKTDLKMSNVLQMNVIGDWIYYIPTANDSDDYFNGIYKIKTDGTSKSTVTTNKVLKYAIENDWVYYVKLEDITITDIPDTIGKLHKVKTDGTSDTLICDSFIDPETPSITVENGCIYYKSAYLPADDAYKAFAPYADNKLYKINVDGTSKTALKSFGDTVLKFTNLNVANGWVYYSLLDNGGIQPSSYTENTYKIKTDGTGEVNFANIDSKIITGINIVNNWIFGNLQSARSYGDWGQMFNFPMKMKTDGSNFDYYDNNICSDITGAQDNNILYKDFYNSDWNVNVNSVEPTKLTGTSPDAIKDLVTTNTGKYYLKKASIYDFYYSLYRSNTDGTGETKLSANVPQFEISNNTIVYTSQSPDECNLYKMNLDGSGQTKLSTNNLNSYSDKFIVQNDTVYYTVNNSQYPDISGIYKTSISSPSDIKIISGSCTDLFSKGNNIFYNKASSNTQNQLWKANMDGTSATTLDSNITLVDYATISDSVFYTKGSSLYKLNIDTNNIVKLVDASPYTIKITPNYILYNQAPGSSTLYKANIDGTSIVKLCDNGEVVFGVTVVGDWVYYAGTLPNQQSDDEARYVFKVKLDGTSGQQTAIRDINKFYNFTN